MGQKVALVLSGGGARGLAHIGVIEELENRGYEITSVAGTSMGAVVGGVYAAGQLRDLKEWAFSLDRRKVLSLVDFSMGFHGLIKGEKMFKKMQEIIPDRLIEDMELPFSAVAAELLSKEEVVFDSGSLFAALRASIAIPTVFTPVKTENGLLVDGGVMNNIPLDHVKRTKGDILVAVNVNANVPLSDLCKKLLKEEGKEKKIEEAIHPKNSKRGYIQLITKTIDLMTWRLDQLFLESYTPDILIDISRDCYTMMDFHKAKELVEIGKDAAGSRL